MEDEIGHLEVNDRVKQQQSIFGPNGQKVELGMQIDARRKNASPLESLPLFFLWTTTKSQDDCSVFGFQSDLLFLSRDGERPRLGDFPPSS
ncbi:MAG: hypothetical protein ACKPKO_16440 [Candidatus Fonsibacter sp.]